MAILPTMFHDAAIVSWTVLMLIVFGVINLATEINLDAFYVNLFEMPKFRVLAFHSGERTGNPFSISTIILFFSLDILLIVIH